METAAFWEKREDGRALCRLCPHACVLAEGRTGLCRVRTVHHGELMAVGYGLISSAGMDPIEKKPLYHFHPGREIFSIGGWGCNFACEFCQNWSISQQVLEESRQAAPVDIVRRAMEGRSIGIAYTYNEPLIAYEFVRDCAVQARHKGLVNVLVTNGYIQPPPAAELLPLIDALNIDLKSVDDDFYREHCRGRLAPVQAFARQARQAGCHVEITNLVIPGLNDADHNFEALAQWIAADLGPETPLHLSAYRPMYKMDRPATSVDSLLRAHEICRRSLLYVYLGNVMHETGRDTRCPDCGEALIERLGYVTRVAGIDAGKCRQCERKADIVT